LNFRAYVLRHGSTALSPAPEGWKPIGLNPAGRSEAMGAADFLGRLIRQGAPQPDWGVSSDLPRAEQTLAIVSDVLQIPTSTPLFALRAFEDQEESPAEYEKRNVLAFEGILKKAAQTNTVPLIVCHRSSTGFLAKQHKLDDDPDYRYDALLLEGGILALDDCGLVPLYRALEANWPEHLKCPI
jgi:phosphohistidine phosphatase SixA